MTWFARNPSTTGALLILASLVWFSVTTFCLLGVHALPPSTLLAHPALAWLTTPDGQYYALLLPLSVAVYLVMAYPSWAGWHLFTHAE